MCCSHGQLSDYLIKENIKGLNKTWAALPIILIVNPKPSKPQISPLQVIWDESAYKPTRGELLMLEDER